MRKGLPLAAAAVATVLGAACFAVPAAGAATATITEFAAVPGSLPGTHITRYVEVGPEGAIWWSENGTEPGIGRITTAGLRLPRISDPDAPADLIRAADGTMYWTGDEGVGRKKPSGVPEPLTRPGFSEGLGLTAAGAVRWGENVGGTSEGVYRFAGDAWGAAVQPLFTTPGSGSVTGMALGPEGHLWVAFPGANLLRVLDAAGLAVERTVELPPGSGPSRLALGPDGDLWVTMFDADAIDRIAADGSRVRFPLPAGSSPARHRRRPRRRALVHRVRDRPDRPHHAPPARSPNTRSRPRPPSRSGSPPGPTARSGSPRAKRGRSAASSPKRRARCPAAAAVPSPARRTRRRRASSTARVPGRGASPAAASAAAVRPSASTSRSPPGSASASSTAAAARSASSTAPCPPVARGSPSRAISTAARSPRAATAPPSSPGTPPATSPAPPPASSSSRCRRGKRRRADQTVAIPCIWAVGY